MPEDSSQRLGTCTLQNCSKCCSNCKNSSSTRDEVGIIPDSFHLLFPGRFVGLCSSLSCLSHHSCLAFRVYYALGSGFRVSGLGHLKIRLLDISGRGG